MPEFGDLVAFFDFKGGRDGLLHFSGMTACSETLSVITLRRFCVQATDSTGKPASDTPARDKNKPTLDRYYNSVYFILHDKFWIGHGLGNSDWPKLQKEFDHIGKPYPVSKGIIDTVPFISSGTKLAQLAVLFGLGEPSVGYYNNCEENYDAIKQCRDAMPILDMEEEQDMGMNIYPMISHLMKFQQPPEKATTKRKSQSSSARGSEPRKSQKLEENPPLKSLAESPSSLEERLVAMKTEGRVTFFDFKKGSNGLLHFGGMEATSKTLEVINETGFCVQATNINGKPARRNTPAWLKNEPTLSESYDFVYYMLHNKTWIGHDLRKSDFPMLEKECKHIGKPSPRPKAIIDTVPFISSGSKLGKLAVLLGLGKPTARLDCKNCLVNYNAIKKCRDAMPILDVEIEQDKESNMHPMISLIKEYQPAEEETTILFGHEEETTKRKSPQGKVKDGGVRKSLRLKEASQRLKKKSM